MRRSLHDAWWRLVTSHQTSPADHALRAALRAGSWVYGGATGARNLGYDRGWLRTSSLPRPVISVGNLSVGGTGKTACVAWLGRKLAQLGKRVAILSRGYGSGAAVRGAYWLRSRAGAVLINDERPVSPAEEWPDEPQMLAMQLPDIPIVIGHRRERTGQLAIDRLGAQILILDDGLQYRRLTRSCEIVLVGAAMPLGGWPLLPRGPLREPLSSLRRADLVIITKADQSLETVSALQERLKTLARQAVMATAAHEPVAIQEPLRARSLTLEHAEHARLLLISSIGDPDSFERTAQRLDAAVLAHATYPDHYRYTATDWAQLVERARASRAEAIMTTEKDWMRLRRLATPGAGNGGAAPVPVWVLQVRMRLLTGEDAVDARLSAV